MTDKKMNIHQRMNAVMRDLTYIKKEGYNKFHSFKFAKHDDVTAAVRAQMVEHGIITEISVTDHDRSVLEVGKKDSYITTLHVDVTFVNIDTPTDRYTSKVIGYGIDKNDLGPGKAESYAVKVAYLKAFALETGEKDIDELADDTPVKQAPTQNDPAQVALFNKIGSAMKAAKDPQTLQTIWDSLHSERKSLPEVAQVELEAYRVSHTKHLMEESAADPFPGDMP